MFKASFLKQSRKNRLLHGLFLLLIFLCSACPAPKGGSSDPVETTPKTTMTLSGVASSGVAVHFTNVEIRDNQGRSWQALTNEQGKFSLELPLNLAFPLLLSYTDPLRAEFFGRAILWRFQENTSTTQHINPFTTIASDLTLGVDPFQAGQTIVFQAGSKATESEYLRWGTKLVHELLSPAWNFDFFNQHPTTQAFSTLQPKIMPSLPEFALNLLATRAKSGLGQTPQGSFIHPLAQALLKTTSGSVPHLQRGDFIWTWLNAMWVYTQDVNTLQSQLVNLDFGKNYILKINTNLSRLDTISRRLKATLGQDSSTIALYWEAFNRSHAVLYEAYFGKLSDLTSTEIILREALLLDNLDQIIGGLITRLVNTPSSMLSNLNTRFILLNIIDQLTAQLQTYTLSSVPLDSKTVGLLQSHLESQANDLAQVFGKALFNNESNASFLLTLDVSRSVQQIFNKTQTALSAQSLLLSYVSNNLTKTSTPLLTLPSTTFYDLHTVQPIYSSPDNAAGLNNGNNSSTTNPNTPATSPTTEVSLNALTVGNVSVLDQAVITNQILYQDSLLLIKNTLQPDLQIQAAQWPDLSALTVQLELEQTQKGLILVFQLKGVRILQNEWRWEAEANLEIADLNRKNFLLKLKTDDLQNSVEIKNQNLLIKTSQLLESVQRKAGLPLKFLANTVYSWHIKTPSLMFKNKQQQLFNEALGCFILTSATSSTSAQNQSCYTSLAKKIVPTVPSKLIAWSLNDGALITWQGSVLARSYSVYYSNKSSINTKDPSSYQGKYDNLKQPYFSWVATLQKSCGETNPLAPELTKSIIVVAENEAGLSLPSATLSVSSVPLQRVFNDTRLQLQTQVNAVGEFTIKWNPLQNAKKYSVQAIPRSAEGLELPTANEQSTPFTSLTFKQAPTKETFEIAQNSLYTNTVTPGSSWKIILKAIDETDKVLDRLEELIWIGQLRPPPPLAMWAQTGNQSIDLQWCANPLAQNYLLQYQESASVGSPLQVNVVNNQILFTNLKNDLSYPFRVRANVNLLKSAFGDTYNITPSTAQNMDLSVQKVTFNQGVEVDLSQLSQSSLPLIAGKSGILRIFPKVTGGPNGQKTRLRLSGSNNGVALTPIIKEFPAVETSTNDLITSGLPIIIDLPYEWLQPAVSIVLELNPFQDITESNFTNNRFPASGELSLPFVTTKPMKIRLVTLHTIKGGQVTLSNELVNKLRQYLIAIYPLADVQIEVHRTALTLNNPAGSEGWSQALETLELFRQSDVASNEGDVFYYGLLRNLPESEFKNYSGTVGLAYTNSPTSTSLPTLTAIGVINEPFVFTTFAHELAHNQGRNHVENIDEKNDYCLRPNNVDSSYPYNISGLQQARLGQTGYNAFTRELLFADAYHDLMSFCARTWISDFTYRGIYDFQIGLQNRFKTSRISNNSKTAEDNAAGESTGLSIQGKKRQDHWEIAFQLFTQIIKPLPAEPFEGTDQKIPASTIQYQLRALHENGQQSTTNFSLQTLDDVEEEWFKIDIASNSPVQHASIVRLSDGQVVTQFNVLTSPRLSRSAGDAPSRSGELLLLPQRGAKHRLVRVRNDDRSAWRVLHLDQDQKAVELAVTATDLIEVQYLNGLEGQKYLLFP